MHVYKALHAICCYIIVARLQANFNIIHYFFVHFKQFLKTNFANRSMLQANLSDVCFIFIKHYILFTLCVYFIF